MQQGDGRNWGAEAASHLFKLTITCERKFDIALLSKCDRAFCDANYYCAHKSARRLANEPWALGGLCSLYTGTEWEVFIMVL